MLCVVSAGALILAGCGSKPDPRPLRDRDLALYLAWLIDEHTAHRIVADTLTSGDTLLRRMVSRGVSHSASLRMIEASRDVDYLARVYPGETYEVSVDSGGEASALRYRRRDGRTVIVEEQGQGFCTRVEWPASRVEVRAASGMIRHSLYEAFIDCGLGPDMVLQFADAFAWVFDFLTECRVGDQFGVVYEEHTTAGSRLLAARYRQRDRELVAIGMEQEGKLEYFAPDGRSLRTAFLRSPLNYRRISSGFSFSRRHPVFGVRRPHLGVDYAAPAGTPVVAVAQGTVAFAGWRRGFGNYVELKHPGGVVTTYGHLRGMASGVRTGALVDQGQVIGSVGATGIATGPHLDYRVKVHGHHVNPLTFQPPRGPTLDPDRMDELQFRTLLAQSALAHVRDGPVVTVGGPGRLLCAEARADTIGESSLPGFNHSREDLVRTSL
ncbi:M23 family metallopeptidase [Candidatus Fermentibacteria bacterium]|nr:M23 family metallopeptidase [Candidatus Fermentibacteria bacterium]